jgi:hypothetical protein
LEVVRFTTLAQKPRLYFAGMSPPTCARLRTAGAKRGCRLEAKLMELDAHIERAQARRMMVLKLIGEVREARAGRAQSIQIGRSARGR